MKERYFNREIDRILQNDVEIPREVEMKMEKALRQIGAKEIQKKKAKKSLRFQVALALAGAMILGTVTVGATGFFLWDKDVATDSGGKESSSACGGICHRSGSDSFSGTVSDDGKRYVSLL